MSIERFMEYCQNDLKNTFIIIDEIDLSLFEYPIFES